MDISNFPYAYVLDRIENRYIKYEDIISIYPSVKNFLDEFLRLDGRADLIK